MTSRRHFLHVAGSGALLWALPTWAKPLDHQRIHLGHSLYGMKDLPLRDAISTCARIGFDNVELAADPGFSADPSLMSKSSRKELRQLLAEKRVFVSALMRNIRVVGGMTPAENRTAIAQVAELAHDLGADAVPPLETTLGGKTGDWDQARFIDTLADWVVTAKANDCVICVKAHINMAVNTPDKLATLLRTANSPALRATFDYSHFEPQGISLEESWAALSAFTRFVHVKDTRKEGDKMTFLLPGEGQLDYRKYFELLLQSGYSGPVVSEVSSMVFRQPGYDAVNAAERCHQVLSRALLAANS